VRLLDRVRVRVLWVVVGVAAMALGVIAWTTLPAWPIVGAAVATLVLAVNTLGRNVRQDSCMACGHHLAQQPRGEHGVACPGCGQVNQPYA